MTGDILTGIRITPSVLTSTGKPVPVGINDEKQEVTIYDTDFNVVKTFNYSAENQKSRQYVEIATVKPSGAKVTWENSWDFNNDPENNVATTLNEMTQLLSNAYGISNWFGFTDYKGRTSCWSPDRTPCFDSEWLGANFPYNYYCIEDGHVKEIQVEYQPEFNQTTTDNATWTIEGDVREYEWGDSPESFDYLDYDANIAFDDGIQCTQTLFNDDDKWEYIVHKYGAVVKDIEDNQYWYWDRIENGYNLRRTVHEGQQIVGFDIKNENGEIVASINEEAQLYDVYKIGGNIYLVLYLNNGYTFYKYDAKLASIKEVARSDAQMANIRVNGHNIVVEANINDVDEAELFDMGGRKMATSSRKGVDNLIINAASATNGVYSVALKKRGRIVGAQKIVLK